MQVKAEKYVKELTLPSNVQESLDQLIFNNVLEKVYGNAVLRALHDNRRTIQLSDLNVSEVTDIQKTMIGTKFSATMKEMLKQSKYQKLLIKFGEDNFQFKFSKGVKKQLLLQMEKCIQGTLIKLQGESDENQLKILSQGIIAYDLPIYESKIMSLQSRINDIQKIVSHGYLSSSKAKIQLEQDVSKFFTWIAMHSKYKKTISEKSIELALKLYTPKEYYQGVHDRAMEATKTYATHKEKTLLENKTDNNGRSKKASVDISVSQCENFLREIHPKINVTNLASVYFAGAIQGFLGLLMLNCEKYLKEQKRKTITPEIIELVIGECGELKGLLE